MKIAILNIFLALALSALLMNGGASNSDSVGSLDEIIKRSEEVDRDSKFLFEWNESQSIRDHDRRCPSSEACRCGVYSFPDVRSLKTIFLQTQVMQFLRGHKSKSKIVTLL